MSIKFYFDKHISKRAASQLRSKGVDVVHCEDIGLGDASDAEHLEAATRENRTVVTHDDDFLADSKEWLSSGREHSGIIFVQSRSQGNVHVLVNQLFEWFELVEGGAATIEDDVRNQHIFIG